LTTRTELSSFSRTKLYRPPVADDYVCREYLEARLGGVEAQPIIVVSAPAGYGKTTMISHWIDQSAAPCAWLSLDTHDNDLRLFLHYLAAAFSEWCPPAARALEKIIESQELPPPSQVADACVSEIDQVEDPLVLVLDDYHSIREIEIHEFVSALLNHMPACLRVAIVSRRRPILSLSPAVAYCTQKGNYCQYDEDRVVYVSDSEQKLLPLSEAYKAANSELVATRIKQAGVRLAKLLDQVAGGEAVID